MGDSNDGSSNASDSSISVSTRTMYLVIAALFSGIGSSISGLTADTSDRYYASDAAKDFSRRDREFTELRHKIEEHLQHSAKYTEKIDEIENDMQDLTDILIRHAKEHFDRS